MPKREPPEPQTGGSIEDTILQAETSLRAQSAKAAEFMRIANETIQKFSALRASGTNLQTRSLDSLP
ncbi:MAG TPA: hypothetical protein VHA06_15000, partial [Candidatus Angelobacter sp.]|nr:hypothetical protein [Candidatus Angelobacter sp.]